ncbi:MAG: hypothetical protein K2K06_00210 [Oscillospiraceae bacterium]|nr:hypothetical protein [Ruminococcus sp.]MDE6706453.1 hypothetical protein [Oscillospiraceae bacterium]
MPDLDDLLGGLEEPTYQETEKRGAPKIDEADLLGLLGDEPEVWSGNEQKKGAPVLSEQVLLDEPEQTWQENKSKPDASVLNASIAEDLLGSNDVNTYDAVAEFCKKLQFDDGLKKAFVTLDAEKQMQVVKMRANALKIPVPMIPNELRPHANTEQPKEQVMLEEAPKQEEYVPKFKDEDLERVKAEAQKPRKYTPPQVELTEEQKQESRRLMAQMREDREREQAKQGFKQLIMLAVIGIIGAVAFCLFFSDMFGLGNKMEEVGGFAQKVKSIAGYVGAGIGIGAILLIAPIPQLKGLCKLLDIIGFILMLFPGIPLLIQTEGNMLINAILYAVAILVCGISVFLLITSDNIRMYNKYGNS